MSRRVPAALVLLAFAACSPDPEGSGDAGLPADGGVADAGPADGGGGGACNLSVQYALGFPCDRDADCLTGHCRDDGLRRWCSVTCEATGNCPSGYTCTPDGATEGTPHSWCVPATTGPGNRTLAAGSPCNRNEDCQGTDTQCVNYDQGATSFCAPACSEEKDCGECGECLFNTGLGHFCLPRGRYAIGHWCENRHDCESFYCAGFCTRLCNLAFDDPGCPEDATCEQVGPDKWVCATAANKGQTPANGACTFDFECAGGRPCRPLGAGGKRICFALRLQGETCTDTPECAAGLRCLPGAGGTRTCEPPGPMGTECTGDADCGSGLKCRVFSGAQSSRGWCAKGCADGCTDGACVAPDLDTELRVYESSDASPEAPLARNDNATTFDKWSALAFEPLSSGTYYVRVSAFAGSLGGYRLDAATDASTDHAPAEVAEVEPDNDARHATAVPSLPAAIAGSIDSATDADWFALTVSGPGTVRLRTSRGAPSACLPASLVGQVAAGDPCKLGVECATGLCDGALQVCATACAGGAPCADGFGCVVTDSGSVCVKNERIGTAIRRAACDYNWECADGYCVTLDAQRFCTLRCETGGCPYHMGCATLKVEREGAWVVEKACIDDGNTDTPFNGRCWIDSDCLYTAPGTPAFCVDGRCSRACATDADCPAQSFPPAGTDVACAPCPSDELCGDTGTCSFGLENERFCALPCSDQGQCGAGFRCQSSNWTCQPAHGSCRRPECVATPDGGRCVVPAAGAAEICAADADCTTGLCGAAAAFAGLPLCTGTCSGTCAWCANGDFDCASGSCALAAGIAAEAEPNGLAGRAQALASGAKVLGSLQPDGTARDRDVYRLPLHAGDELGVQTRAVCDTAAAGLDLAVTLQKDGRVVARDDPSERYGRFVYTVPADGDYFLFVDDRPYGTAQTGAYVLEASW